MTNPIIPIPAFNDNYIWLVLNERLNQCVVVDPGDAAPVLIKIKELGARLTNILITHHHWDHTGGVKELVKKTGAHVYGPCNSSFREIDTRLSEGNHISVLSKSLELDILEIPGHTLDHIAYFNSEVLFCGDTLFSGGCGKVFEGTCRQMHDSLQKLASLDPETRVYCAHEYTLANLKFALEAEPGNPDLLAYQARTMELAKQHLPSLPSSIGQELLVNPFLRTGNRQLAERIEKKFKATLPENWQVFEQLRTWKNHF